jgi:hypothetical protein
MVVIPLNLWYAIRPFLHIMCMANISSGIVSFCQINTFGFEKFPRIDYCLP